MLLEGTYTLLKGTWSVIGLYDHNFIVSVRVFSISI